MAISMRAVKGLLLSAIEAASSLLRCDGAALPEDVRRILVAETGGIGDVLLVLPALEVFRLAFPEASITMLASPHGAEALSLYPHCDAIAEVVPYRMDGPHRTAWGKLLLSASLRKRRFDLIYSPDRGEGMREEALMAFLAGGRCRLGFRKGRIGLLNTVSVEFREDRAILSQNLDVLRAAGIRSAVDKVPLRVPESSRNEASILLSSINGRDPLLVLHPGAVWGGGLKNWPIAAYRELLTLLFRDTGAVVVVVGSQGERGLCEELTRGFDEARTLDLAGRTSVSVLAGVIERAAVFVGSDSGPLHIASALGRPFVGLFGPTCSGQVLPDSRQGVILGAGRNCRPCYVHQDAFAPPCGATDSPPCMMDVRAEAVTTAVSELLRKAWAGKCA